MLLSFANFFPNYLTDTEGTGEKNPKVSNVKEMWKLILHQNAEEMWAQMKFPVNIQWRDWMVSDSKHDGG